MLFLWCVSTLISSPLFFHIPYTKVYPTLTGVTSAGDMYVPYSVHPSQALERVRFTHHALKLQFNIKDFNEMKSIRRERVATTSETSDKIMIRHSSHTQQELQQHNKGLSPSAAKTLSVRASLLFEQLTADDPSAALSLTRFGSLHPHPHRLHKWF